jgi:hypothetical protein
MADSADHARRATISFDEWCRRMRQLRGYEYQRTEWYKAGKALEAEAAEPPRTPAVLHGSRCVYFSNVTDYACRRFAELGGAYTALFTADPNPAYRLTDDQLSLARAGGGTVAAWADCADTTFQEAQTMAERRRLAFAGGQAESDAQYLRCTQAGGVHLVGNPANLHGALGEAQQRSFDGTLAFIGEVLHPDPSYSAQGVNISSACFYVDRDVAQGGYIPLSAYAGMPRAMREGCSVFAAGRMQAEDWDTYAAWTHP